MRNAWRFCEEKKLDEFLLSFSRIDSSASLPAGSWRAGGIAAAADASARD